MKKICVGLLFALVPLSFWNGINYMPACLGYVLIFLGLGRKEGESVPASRTIALASAVLTAAVWVGGLLGYGMVFPVEATLRVVITWRLVKWCEEQDWGLEHLTGKLRMSWYALTGAAAAGFLLGMANWAMGTLWSLVAVAAGIYFTYIFYRLSRVVSSL